MASIMSPVLCSGSCAASCRAGTFADWAMTAPGTDPELLGACLSAGLSPSAEGYSCLDPPAGNALMSSAAFLQWCVALPRV